MGIWRSVALASTAIVAVALSAPAEAATPVVTVAHMAFTPSALPAALGSGPEFAFRDSVAHTTTSNQGFWNSGPKTDGQNYFLYIGAAGTFAYHCALHPSMTGTIRVPATSAVTSKGVFVRWGVFPPPLPSGIQYVGGTAFAVQYHLMAAGASWVTWAVHTTLRGQYFHPAAHGTYAVRVFTWNGTVHSAWSPNAVVHY